MEVLTRVLGSVQRANNGIDPKEHIIPFIASTETTTDSHRSRIYQDGLDWKTRYEANPLFAWSHPLNGECVTPSHRRALGKGIEVQRHDGYTLVRVKFAVKSNPDAKEAFEMYADGFLNACSIGVGAPYREVWRTSPENEILALPERLRIPLLAKECDFVVAQGVVLELSGCLAGSNFEALAQRGAEDVGGSSSDRRLEARERALCTRAQGVLDQLDDRLARIDAATARLERAFLTPAEREFAEARAALSRASL